MTQINALDDLEAIQALRATRFGWLSAEGGLIACDLHAHLDILAGRGIVTQAELDTLAHRVGEIAATRRHCHSIQCEWHEVEKAEARAEDARHRIMSRLYGTGWIRLGIHEKKPTLHAEGLGRWLRQRRADLEDLAAMLHLELKAEPFDQVFNGYDRNFPSFLERD